MMAGIMSNMETSNTGKYICQWSSASNPAFRSDSGTTSQSAISVACNANTPKFRRNNSGSCSTLMKRPGAASVSEWKRQISGLGIIL